MWTHIVASIDVDTFIQSDTIKEDVEKMLEKAPKITGSQGPADVFVNVLSGHCISIYENDECKKFQSRIVITVIGDLGDRMKDQTEKEWKAFKDFIGIEPEFYNEDREGLNFEIRNCSCEIKG
jgi:hypothetical protein